MSTFFISVVQVPWLRGILVVLQIYVVYRAVREIQKYRAIMRMLKTAEGTREYTNQYYQGLKPKTFEHKLKRLVWWALFDIENDIQKAASQGKRQCNVTFPYYCIQDISAFCNKYGTVAGGDLIAEVNSKIKTELEQRHFQVDENTIIW